MRSVPETPPGQGFGVSPRVFLGDMDIHAVRRRLGKPGYHRCARCNGHSRYWVYDDSDPDARTVQILVGLDRTRTIRYSTDLSRYDALCRECSLRRPPTHRLPNSAS